MSRAEEVLEMANLARRLTFEKISELERAAVEHATTPSLTSWVALEKARGALEGAIEGIVIGCMARDEEDDE